MFALLPLMPDCKRNFYLFRQLTVLCVCLLGLRDRGAARAAMTLSTYNKWVGGLSWLLSAYAVSITFAQYLQLKNGQVTYNSSPPSGVCMGLFAHTESLVSDAHDQGFAMTASYSFAVDGQARVRLCTRMTIPMVTTHKCLCLFPACRCRERT
jgi:hypothetical protein